MWKEEMELLGLQLQQLSDVLWNTLDERIHDKILSMHGYSPKIRHQKMRLLTFADDKCYRQSGLNLNFFITEVLWQVQW